MATRLDPPVNCRTTDHADEIQHLRDVAAALSKAHGGTQPATALLALVNGLAADLLQSHDDTGISLDNWDNARGLVEVLLNEKILENGV